MTDRDCPSRPPAPDQPQVFFGKRVHDATNAIRHRFQSEIRKAHYLIRRWAVLSMGFKERDISSPVPNGEGVMEGI
jgi:hypothetical protein